MYALSGVSVKIRTFEDKKLFFFQTKSEIFREKFPTEFPKKNGTFFLFIL